MTEAQTAAIRAHLEAGRSLNPREALTLFGCFRLSARIYDLRKDGMDIESGTVEDVRTGNRYAEYYVPSAPLAATPAPAPSKPGKRKKGLTAEQIALHEALRAEVNK